MPLMHDDPFTGEERSGAAGEIASGAKGGGGGAGDELGDPFGRC